MTFEAWSGEHRQRIEARLARVLPGDDSAAPRLAQAMRYAALGGGKRVRPLLAYAASEISGADIDRVDAAAVAVELVHAYSLVHDDLPCMDDDALRRGRPTCHVAFDVATALLAGDALQSLAFAVLGDAADASACTLLATAAGQPGMAGGQQLDIDATGRTLDVEALTQMHALKTGALIRAAVQLGARCGTPLDATETRALDRYASAAGLAFQVGDDILDVAGSAATLGKTAGKDAVQHKVTFVTLLGVDEAQRRLHALHDDARAALAPFGARGRRLREIADWIVLRRS
ncbi:MAG TPA: farnesyl diphosphate synthase [Casimicrobiaceae bacterium]|nr:farnesyl diphosphate synthase [Casimicrobiaceae bacterium]